MLQFGHEMEQLLCAKIRHVITAPHRALVDEYLKLCTCHLRLLIALTAPQPSTPSRTRARVCARACAC